MEIGDQSGTGTTNYARKAKKNKDTGIEKQGILTFIHNQSMKSICYMLHALLARNRSGFVLHFSHSRMNE